MRAIRKDWVLVKQLARAYHYVCRIEEAVAQILLVAIVGLIFIAAVARTIGHPLAWVMDMATLLFAWVVFLAADVAMRKDRHVKLDLFTRLLPSRVQFVISVLLHVVILVFLVLLVRWGVSLSFFTRFRTFQGIPGFSYMWATLSIPVGSLLLAITTSLKLGELMRKNVRLDPKAHGEEIGSFKG